MYVELAISDPSAGQTAGTVQVFRQTLGGQVQQTWEWAGGPDAYDGGTWVWRTDTRGGGRMPYMELRSNLYGRVIGLICSERWIGKPTPPPQPWFPSSHHEDAGLFYFTTSGLKIPYDWDTA